MYDCITVGGGLLGLFSALELHRAGLRVAVCERGAAAQESTWAGGGIVSPLYPWRYPASVIPLARWSQTRYPEFCTELAADTGVDPEYTPSGMLVLGLEDAEQAAAWAQTYGYLLQTLSTPAQVTACESALSSPPDGALWLPEVGQIRNPRLGRAATQAVRNAGIELREDAPVDEILFTEERVQGVKIGAEILSAPRVVIAAGAWSKTLFPAHLPAPEVVPVRGQMLVFAAPPQLLRRIVLQGRRYLIPRRDGHVLVGSTLEHTGFVKQTTTEAREDLYNFATGLVPDLAECEVAKHWAGLRPGSPDGVPYIGEHPHLRGLYFNTGHFRNGVVLGLASARLLADLICARPPIVDPAPYALESPRAGKAE